MNQVVVKRAKAVKKSTPRKEPRKVKDLTVDELKIIIEDVVDAKLEEYLGDPDEGLEVREEFLAKLRAQRASPKPRLSMEEVEATLGIKK